MTNPIIRKSYITDNNFDLHCLCGELKYQFSTHKELEFSCNSNKDTDFKYDFFLNALMYTILDLYCRTSNPSPLHKNIWDIYHHFQHIGENTRICIFSKEILPQTNLTLANPFVLRVFINKMYNNYEDDIDLKYNYTKIALITTLYHLYYTYTEYYNNSCAMKIIEYLQPKDYKSNLNILSSSKWYTLINESELFESIFVTIKELFIHNSKFGIIRDYSFLTNTHRCLHQCFYALCILYFNTYKDDLKNTFNLNDEHINTIEDFLNHG